MKSVREVFGGQPAPCATSPELFAPVDNEHWRARIVREDAAKAICRGCVAKVECSAAGSDDGFTVRGGMTPSDRGFESGTGLPKRTH